LEIKRSGRRGIYNFNKRKSNRKSNADTYSERRNKLKSPLIPPPCVKRNDSIALMKCVGCFFIMFAHSGNLLGPCKNYAFGGMFGNAVFFFSSGFFLFKKIELGFDNWYKKRIARIYPSVFAAAMVLSFFGLSHDDMKGIILNGGGWFVSCIMIHYVGVYIICKYFLNKLGTLFVIISGIIVILFIFGKFETDFNNVPLYFKWGFWFLFTLLGGIIGKRTGKIRYSNIDILLSIILVGIYYIVMYFADIYSKVRSFDILALVPLFFGTYYFYKACNSNIAKSLLAIKYVNKMVCILSLLALEIYIIQFSILKIIGTNWDKIFPLNLPAAYVIIIISGYIIKITANIFSQIFNDNIFNWAEIIAIRK
jgi:hypothetical protein